MPVGEDFVLTVADILLIVGNASVGLTAAGMACDVKRLFLNVKHIGRVSREDTASITWSASMHNRSEIDHQHYISGLQALVRQAVTQYGWGHETRISLLSHSENTVFRVEDATRARRAVMRVHRAQYQTYNAIRSELDWMAALNNEGLHTPQALRTIDGRRLYEVDSAQIGPRIVAMFEWVEGGFPDEGNLAPSMQQLGELSARMHRQSRQWTRPDYFERMSWDTPDTVGDAARWGRWQDAPGLSKEQLATLTQARDLLCQRLSAFGAGPEKFGLIHADLRLANLLVDGEKTTIIDFDDCGFGWFLNDMASALSFIEHRADRRELMLAWAEGYARHQRLDERDLAEFPTFLLQRRMQLLAWMASHSETDLAKSLGLPWVAASADLAEEYLRTMA